MRGVKFNERTKLQRMCSQKQQTVKIEDDIKAKIKPN